LRSSTSAAASSRSTTPACTAAELGQGVLEGECVTCPWHGWQYNVTTGEAVFNEQIKVATYEVQVEGDDICVGL
jgi:nitrite reductase/ring-hydroxylating ferredoxin subunit